MNDELWGQLEDLYLLKEQELKSKYNRSLPFQDALFDRYKRAERLGFGEKSNIYNSALVYGDVRVGKNVWIGPYTILDGSCGTVEIGDHCCVGAGAHIYTHDNIPTVLSGGKLKGKTGQVTIKSKTFIGPQCMIRMDVHIGEQCIITGNSFVNKDVPDRTIVGGSPAKKIGEVHVEGDDIKLVY